MNEPHDPNATSDIPPAAANSVCAADAPRTTNHVRGSASTDGSQPPADAPADDLPAVPGYRVLREIARGGMGCVLAAYDLTLDRDVALKILLPGAHADRFVRESKITARLPHPGIPPVHALGTLADGSPFLAMKLIAGRTLADEMKTADRPRLLQAFLQVCQAVGFAHSRGIIHRDLKPANVMVGAFGEVQVMDWGLAKDRTSRDTTDEARPSGSPPAAVGGADPGATTDHHGAGESTDEQTQAGQVLGTPAYMAPEQARGEAADARADVFALGGILCALLTGQPPFGGRSAPEVIRRAGAADLAETHARLERCGADVELIALCRRCLSPRPADRPADGQAVAEQMTAYLDGVQERLRQAELAQAEARAKAAEEAKRRRLTLALAAAVVALLLGGGAFAFWRNQQAQAGRERDVRNAEAVAALLNQGEEALKAGDAAKAHVALEAARKRSGEGGAEQQAQRLGRLDADLALLRDLDAADQFHWAMIENKSQAWPAVVTRFREALRRFGADPEATSEDGAAARVSASVVRERIVTALDLLLALQPSDRVHALLRRVDADPYREALRAAILAENDAKVVELAGQKAALEQPPGFVTLLGGYAAIDVERRRQLLQAALSRRQNNLGLLTTLGATWDINRKETANERLRWYQAAIAAAPSNSSAHNNLGIALKDLGRTDEAIACYHKALALNPNLTMAHTNLGIALRAQGKVDEAIACFHKAIALNPNVPQAHNSLGTALLAKGKVDEAIAEYQKAIALDSKLAGAHNSLGNALLGKGQVEEAIKCYQTAIELDSQYAHPHNGLGNALKRKGQVDEAIKCYHKAIALDPKYANAHFNLGVTLYQQRKVDGAIDCWKKAIALDPKHARAHFNLGAALAGKGKVEEAIACWKKAIALDPKDARAHFNLANALKRQGRYAESLEAYKRGHELGMKQPSWRLPSAAWVREAERLAALEANLSAFLKGNLQPKNTAERLALVGICRAKRLYATASRMSSDAFAADPKLADNLKAWYRYNAACWAALAAAGKGEDAAKLDDKERARLRKQALDWLKADLALHAKKLESGRHADRAEVQRDLKEWQEETDLADLRDRAALEKLPPDEQKACTQLWADVAALRKKAEKMPN
jgi:tetratricopeptide (TPR) repeat protein